MIGRLLLVLNIQLNIFKPVKPNINYQVSGLVIYEHTWKNPMYTHLKMTNLLREKDSVIDLVSLDTSFLIYTPE